MTREDRRSLLLHRAVADKLREKPGSVLAIARSNVARMSATRPHARGHFEQWAARLELPVDALIERILDQGETMREMRHRSVFAGILDAKEHGAILREHGPDYRIPRTLR